MKTNILLIVIFLSFTLLAYSGLFSIPPVDRIGSTELNGQGCVCHSLFENPLVQVWVEGPETLSVGQTGLYKMFLTGGPAEAGGYNVAGKYGTMGLVDTISFWDYRAPNELTQAFPLVFPTPQDTIFWPFDYTASDSSDVDTIYSCGLSIVYDSIPDFYDIWAFGPKFPLTIIDDVTPVELTSFTVKMNKKSALIKWTTATEINNRGFEIEKKDIDDKSVISNWVKIGFVEGYGTTSEANEYTFIDKDINNIRSLYRLKQIDFDGRFQYSDAAELNAEGLFNFELSQNYPNPFNPATTIKIVIPESADVKLTVYDILGEEVAELLNEEKASGVYEVEFDASGLSSGLYFYKLEVKPVGSQSEMLSEIKKMVLLK